MSRYRRRGYRRGGRGGSYGSSFHKIQNKLLPLCKCGRRCRVTESSTYRSHWYYTCFHNRCDFRLWEDDYMKNPNLVNVQSNKEFYYLQNNRRCRNLKRDLDIFFSRIVEKKPGEESTGEESFNCSFEEFRRIYESYDLGDADIYHRLREIVYPNEGRETREIEKRAPNNFIKSKESSGTYRWRDIEAVLPRDFKCESVLDYGCCDGSTTRLIGKDLGLVPDQIFGADVIHPNEIPLEKKVVRTTTRRRKKKAAPPRDDFMKQEEDEHDDRDEEEGEIEEIEEEIIEEVQEQGLGFRYVFIDPKLKECRLTEIPDGSIDLIVSLMTLHHVEFLESTMKELYRVINKEKGIIILREHDCDHQDFAIFLDIVHGSYARVFSKPMENPRFSETYFAKYRSSVGWRNVMEDHGFVPMDSSTRSVGIFKSFYATFIPNIREHEYFDMKKRTGRKRDREYDQGTQPHDHPQDRRHDHHHPPETDDRYEREEKRRKLD